MRPNMSAWTPDLLFLIFQVSILVVGVACMAAVGGYLHGFREAVRKDYAACAADMRDRDEANHDLKPRDPPFVYESCAAHLDAVYGGKGWRP